MAPTATTAAEPTTDAAVSTAAVEIDGHVLFHLRGTAALPAEERAGRVEARIMALAADPTFRTTTLNIVADGEYIHIQAGKQRLLTLVDADARATELSVTVLADIYVQRITRAVTEYRQARQPSEIVYNAFVASAATIALVLVVLVLVALTARLDRRLERRFDARIRQLESQSFELLRAEQIRSALRNLLGGVRTLTLFVAALVYAQFVLGRFPWTRGYGHRLWHLIVGPASTIAYAVLASIPNLVFLALLFLIVRFALRLASLFFDAVARGSIRLRRFDRDWAAPTYRIVRLAMVAFGLVVAYPYIPGSSSAAFKGVSLFFGLVFSLGSSSVISNLIAGYTMTYRRAFKVGDRIGIGDTIGDVIETRLQVTHLRSFKNEEIVIPNSLILSSQIVNCSSLARERGLILHLTVGIGYETPWRQVEAMLMTAAERTPKALKEPSPFVLYRKLGDFAVEYELNLYCGDAHDMLSIYTALSRNVLDVFNEFGVQIMTPAYERDPEQPKVVPPSQWYLPPAQSASNESQPEAAKNGSADALRSNLG